MEYILREHVSSIEKDGIKNKNRLLAVDRLRSIGVLFVVFHHSIIPYCERGIPWYLQDTGGVIVFDVVMLLNDTFMMPVLFFVSGHLLPLSWCRPPRTFIAVKARRLLLPLCVSIVFLGSIIAYARANGRREWSGFLFELLVLRISGRQL